MESIYSLRFDARQARSAKVSRIKAAGYSPRTDELDLISIISLSLNNRTSGALADAIRTGAPLPVVVASDGSRAWLAKVLREEVQRQFSHTKRPLIELIANCVDARPAGHSGLYVVDTRIGSSSFTVSDNGTGMGLESVLGTLLVPFVTEKDSLRDLGRFGVGFFSSLEYCISRPNRASVTVFTSDGSEGYEISITARGASVEDLKARFRRFAPKSRGTTVHVSGLEIDKREVLDFITEYLSFFDPNRAVIMLNGKPLNLRKKAPRTYAEYSAPAELYGQEGSVVQNVRVAVDAAPAKSSLLRGVSLHSQGVLVELLEISELMLAIDFPSAVLLVEGRNQLKRDANYSAGIEKAVNVLAAYVRQHAADKKLLGELRNAIPAVLGQLPHDNIYSLPAVKSLTSACFPGNEHLVMDFDGYGLKLRLPDFLGDRVKGMIYAPEQSSVHAGWRRLLPDERALVESNVHVYGQPPAVITVSSMKYFLGRPPQNAEIFDALKNRNLGVCLVAVPASEKPRSPMLKLGDTLYINIQHPFFLKSGYVERYGLRTSLVREFGSDLKIDNLIDHVTV